MGWMTLPHVPFVSPWHLWGLRIYDWKESQDDACDQPFFSFNIIPIGSMYAIYGNIYHQYTPNVSIYSIHGSYGYII